MNSNENWELQVRDKVFKALNKLQSKDRQRLAGIIEGLPSDPYRGDIEKLEGEEREWRRRSGAFRIFYEIKELERIIYVFRVERRRSKTYMKRQ
ncbi:MAG: type II toxin-antitoxin system RelE/ParE family toxin [Patescibacteria group bacterium]